MPTSSSVQLNPPANWDEFEDLCADLFAKEWSDPNTVRYGRAGQRQHGIDIFGREDGEPVGTQCKQKREWPPTKLTVAEIDKEIEEAKKFRPHLTKLIFATTAENDVAVTDHVNAVTEAHRAAGLFSVHAYGWKEIVRRIQSYPNLYEKHFGVVSVGQLREELRNIPDAVAAKIEQLQSAKAVIEAPTQGPPGALPVFAPASLMEALERDYENRLRYALQRSFFPELMQSDELGRLAEEVLTNHPQISQPLRRDILLRGARAAAIRKRPDDAAKFIEAAKSLAGSASIPAAEARLEIARGQAERAISILRDEADAEARSVLLNILAVERGDEAALDWMATENLGPRQLAPGGIIALCHIHLRHDAFDEVENILDQLTPEQCEECPYFFLLRGAIKFTSILPIVDRAQALSSMPLDVRSALPMLSSGQLASRIESATNDLRTALPIARSLRLSDTCRLIDGYLAWCDLLHPGRKQAALDQLRKDMQAPPTALPRVQFAFAYDPDFNPSELLDYLARRERFGGLAPDELRALLAIRINQDNSRAIADLLAKHRELAIRTFGKPWTLCIEIQALARSGDATSARTQFESNADEFDDEIKPALRAEIATAEGSDSVTEHLKLYEQLNSPESLRALVAALCRKSDYIAIAQYAEKLYLVTHVPRDAGLAADAYLKAGDGENFVRLYEAHPVIADLNPEFRRAYGWQLFALGRLSDASMVAEALAATPAHRAPNLEIALALETGEWEALAQPLAAILKDADNQDPLSLMRAASLAQASGQGPTMDLLWAAISRGASDPNVLLGGYIIYVAEGLEETRAEAGEWFNKALALSGPEGPIQRVELKEILSQQVTWEDHTRSVQELISQGDLPIVAASTGLRATVVDIILSNLIRNRSLRDGRRRVAIPLFSGRRQPSPIGPAKRVTFDITSLLTLGWLGLLDKSFAAFQEIVVPGGLLIELFEARRNIRRRQRSRIQKARQLQAAIASGQLKILRAPAIGRDNLSAEIGIELAALLREAETNNGIVIRPAPVRRIGVDERNADLTEHHSRLCDMHGLLNVLVDLNLVDEATERSARDYFSLQDEGWPNPAQPRLDMAIHLDGLAVVHLQQTRLFEVVLSHFRTIYVHASTSEEADALLESELHADEVFRIMDDIRAAIRSANSAGKIIFGPKQTGASEEGSGRSIESTLNLLHDLSLSELALFDDRSLNKELIARDSRGRTARIATTLDLIDELAHRGIVSHEERRTLRFRLRAAGAMLMPVDAEDIVASVKRNRANESPEFRAIHDTLDLARLAEMPQFPAEMQWFLSYVHATKAALASIWNEESERERASVLSRAILSLHPLPEEWIARWPQGAPNGWIPAVRRVLACSLALPIQITDNAKIAAYQEWLETDVMSPLRLYSPETYQEVLEYLKRFVELPWSDDADD